MYVTNLSSALANMSLCPSSAISRLEFATDALSLKVSMSCGSDVIYSATLFSFSERVSVERPDQVIGDYMLAHGLHRAKISVYAYQPGNPVVSQWMELDVLYCAYALPEGFSPAGAFFSLWPIQRIPPSAMLHAYGNFQQGDTVDCRVSGRKADGSPDSWETQLTVDDGFVFVHAENIAKAASNSTGLSSVSTISLFHGRAVKSFAVQQMRSFVAFRFRNCFNCPETVYLSGSSDMVTDIDSEMAVCSGKAVQYNRTVSRTYEHVTDHLTRIEAAALAQLVESPDVSVQVGSEFIPIVITEHDLKVSNDDSSLNSVKFSWRFRDSRPRLFGSTLSPLLESFGIFTHQFQDPFQ